MGEWVIPLPLCRLLNVGRVNASTLDASAALHFPSYSTAGRPTSGIDTGATIYNSTDETLETWNGSEWVKIGGGSDPDGSSADKAASSAAAILQVNPNATDGVYWILLPSVGAKQVYWSCHSQYASDISDLGAGKVTKRETESFVKLYTNR